MTYQEKETKLIYEIIDEFGGDKKRVLNRKIKLLLKNQKDNFIKDLLLKLR